MLAIEREENATRVENELGSVDVSLYGGCAECQSAYGMEPREFYHAVHIAYSINDEGGFSLYSCELCGSHLGGNRYAAHASNTGGITHLDVCEDCLCATANGDPYTDEA